MRFAIKLSLAVIAVGSMMSGAAYAASAERGKEMYVQHGCWQCHGFVGQGGITGPKLGPDPLPLEGLSAFIRSSNGPMPPYPEKILPDADIADIHAYLASVPKPPDYKTIPLLNP